VVLALPAKANGGCALSSTLSTICPRCLSLVVGVRDGRPVGFFLAKNGDFSQFGKYLKEIFSQKCLVTLLQGAKI